MGGDFYYSVGGKRLSAHTAERPRSAFPSSHDCQPCRGGRVRRATAPSLFTFSGANAELMPGFSLAELCPEVELSHHQSSACEGSGNLAALSEFLFSFFPPLDKCPGMSVNICGLHVFFSTNREIFVFHNRYC